MHIISGIEYSVMKEINGFIITISLF